MRVAFLGAHRVRERLRLDDALDLHLRRHAAVIATRRRQYPGGGANPQYPSSINPAMCRHVRSSY